MQPVPSRISPGQVIAAVGRRLPGKGRPTACESQIARWFSRSSPRAWDRHLSAGYAFLEQYLAGLTNCTILACVAVLHGLRLCMPDDTPLPSPTEYQIMQLLIARGERYGLQLVKDSDGKLKRGTVYVTLGRMEDKGLVESREEESTPDYIGIPRRLYKVTGLGVRASRKFEGMQLVLNGGYAT